MYHWDDDEIEARARKFRQAIGVDNLDWLDVPTLMFKLIHLMPGITYSLVDDSDLPDPGGRWDAPNKRLIFRRSIFESANKLNPDVRARFTIVHELVACVN